MINQRIFSANVGDSSVGFAGPDAIEQDIDNLLANDQELEEQINDFAPHPTKLVTETDGVHGLKIEEGTFIPVIRGSTTAGNNIYSFQRGSYYKIGKLVVFELQVRCSTVDSNMAGALEVAGLPFNSKNSPYAVTFGDVRINNTRQILGFVQALNNYIRFFGVEQNNMSTIEASSILVNGGFYIQGSYQIS